MESDAFWPKQTFSLKKRTDFSGFNRPNFSAVKKITNRTQWSRTSIASLASKKNYRNSPSQNITYLILFLPPWVWTRINVLPGNRFEVWIVCFRVFEEKRLVWFMILGKTLAKASETSTSTAQKTKPAPRIDAELRKLRNSKSSGVIKLDFLTA